MATLRMSQRSSAAAEASQAAAERRGDATVLPRRRTSSFSAMPHASPGVGECAICFEVVPCVKVLDCAHCLCTQCASKMIQASADDSITCAECRQATNVSAGLDDLPMRYFGKVRCDLCLEKKPTEDMWWCGECVRALCSKCSIKEHAKRQHVTSEWNANDPVKYAVGYINDVEYRRQLSGGSKLNQAAVHTYLAEVERELMKMLTSSPQLEEIKQSILQKYGTRFSSDTEGSSSPLSSAEDHTEESSRVAAKILQLAGTNVHRLPDTAVAPDAFQVYFGVTPRDVADLLRQHIRLMPIDEGDERLSPPLGGAASGAASTSAPYADQAGGATPTRKISVKGETASDIKSANRVGANIPVLGAAYSHRLQTVVLRLPEEVQLYDTSGPAESSHVCSVSVARAARLVKSACLANGQLMLCLQSVQRSYEWTLECYRPGDTLCSWTALCDIDPDDYVSDVKLAPGHQCFYQLRICQQTISEIWKTTVMGRTKMGNVKLKEILVYQKGDSQISDMAAYEYGKDKYLIVWDDLSSCLYRLIVNKDGRCQQQSTIMHSVHPIAFSLDLRQHLWLYDPHMERICRSRKPISNRHNVSLHTVAKYKENVLRCMDTSAEGDIAFGVATTADTVDLLTFVA